MRKIEVASIISPKKEKDDDTDPQSFEMENPENGHQLRSMSALEIFRETIRILRYNTVGFMAIAALLICPVSAVLLSNVLVDQMVVKRLRIRLLLVAKYSGLPLRPFIKHSCLKLSEMVISSAVCFPLYITLSLLSKAAVVYSVDCTYSRKKFDTLRFYVIVAKIWRRLVSTYMWVCMVISGCITLFLVLLISVSSLFFILGISPDLIVYLAMMMGFVFSVVLANAIIICNTAIVISVLEDVSGPQALLKASELIRGQTQVGLLIFLGSTIGMAFVEGLFEHRVKALSYGGGSSRLWEGPVLVLLYSFMQLIDSMMSSIFYFSCISYRLEALNGQNESVLEALTRSPLSVNIMTSNIQTQP